MNNNLKLQQLLNDGEDHDSKAPWMVRLGGPFLQGTAFALISFAPTSNPIGAVALVAAAMFFFRLAHLVERIEHLSDTLDHDKRMLQTTLLLLTARSTSGRPAHRMGFHRLKRR